MNLRQLIEKLEQIQKAENLPFDIYDLDLAIEGHVYPSSLISAEWCRDYTSFKLIFENN